jgi:hypothetical protein
MAKKLSNRERGVEQWRVDSGVALADGQARGVNISMSANLDGMNL